MENWWAYRFLLGIYMRLATPPLALVEMDAVV